MLATELWNWTHATIDRRNYALSGRTVTVVLFPVPTSVSGGVAAVETSGYNETSGLSNGVFGAGGVYCYTLN